MMRASGRNAGRLGGWFAWILLALIVPAIVTGDEPAARPRKLRSQIGESFRVPYRLTDTNHFLVRVRVNGKGPFNFLVDSGAPALIIGTETAAKVGLKAERRKFWTPIDHLEIEGGARLTELKARVEDPFQLVGMNALGLPGATIDGILGFTILARFRLEIDPTQDRMTWTRLAYLPPDPPTPDLAQGEGPPAAVGAMNMIGPLAKGLAFFLGKQPEEVVRPRGFLGMAWSDVVEPVKGGGVRVTAVLAGSPAARAGVESGDLVTTIGGRGIRTIKDAQAALANLRSGQAVTLTIARGAEAARKITITAGKGL